MEDYSDVFDINIISSGSSGNCVVFDDRIMCDAGVARKKILQSGYDMDKLQVLFVSHHHGDHTNLATIRWCITHGVESHIPIKVVEMLREEGKIDIDLYLNQTVFTHHNDDHYELNLLDKRGGNTHFETVQMFLYPQKHHDIINFAVVLEKEVEQERMRLLYSTDLDTIGPTDVGPGLVALGMFNAIVMEGNFDEDWLRKYIREAIRTIDPYVDVDEFNDEKLDHWVRNNFAQLPRRTASELFRAVQNMRHLSKQQARLYVSHHLLPGGVFYEVHRSSMFYEEPPTWSLDTL